MTRGRWALGLVVAVTLGAALFAPSVLRDVVHVGPGDPLQSAIDRSRPGSRVVLGAGTYEGPVTIDRTVEVVAEPGAVLAVAPDSDAALTVTADGVRVEGLTTTGGDTGIRVREVDGVELEDVSVKRAAMHGIEIIDASASVAGAEVADPRDPFAQGIEVRNADGRADSSIADSVVSGGQEGIVSHVSEVAVTNNVVTGTSLRAITITEMSDGVVHGNTIRDVAGAGLYCGDMSRCEFRDNVVEGVDATPLGRSTEGWGLVVTYHAAASSSGDLLEGRAGPVFTSIGGHMRERTPLELGAGLGALLPVALATGAALLAMVLVLVASKRPALILTARSGRRRSRAGWILPVAVAGLIVQTFHMIEHGLQVFRVRVDGVPSRGGLVGPVVEAEWIHFIYNGLVVAGLVAVVLARSRGWTPPGRIAGADRLLLTAAVIQSYHFVEHSVKLAQHVVGGAKVNPGIAGRFLDLVLFHYAINLAVYLACLGAGLLYASRRRLRTAVARVPRYEPLRG